MTGVGTRSTCDLVDSRRSIAKWRRDGAVLSFSMGETILSLRGLGLMPRLRSAFHGGGAQSGLRRADHIRMLSVKPTATEPKARNWPETARLRQREGRKATASAPAMILSLPALSLHRRRRRIVRAGPSPTTTPSLLEPRCRWASCEQSRIVGLLPMWRLQRAASGRNTAVNHDLAAAINFRPPVAQGKLRGQFPVTAGPRQRTALLKVAASPAEV
jgi:hypothetical protein